MSDGIFLSLSKSYFATIKDSFYYAWHTNWLLKPFALIIATIYTILLLPIGIVFALLIVLDWIGKLTDTIRKSILAFMENRSYEVDNSFLTFLIYPLLLIFIAPLFLLSVFIPKLSSNALVNMSENELSDIISGAGAFKQIKEIIWEAANNLFRYVANANLFLKPFYALIAIVYSIVLIIIGTIFLILIPIDWLSKLIENARQNVAKFADNQHYKIRYSFSSFLFTPIMLILLAPIFLLIILVPKFTTNFDAEV